MPCGVQWSKRTNISRRTRKVRRRRHFRTTCSELGQCLDFVARHVELLHDFLDAHVFEIFKDGSDRQTSATEHPRPAELTGTLSTAGHCAQSSTAIKSASFQCKGKRRGKLYTPSSAGPSAVPQSITRYIAHHSLSPIDASRFVNGCPASAQGNDRILGWARHVASSCRMMSLILLYQTGFAGTGQ